MRNIFRMLLTLVVFGSGLIEPGPGGELHAQSIEDLKALIDELDQKVRVMERNRELEQEAASEKQKALSSVSIGPGGLQVRSADSNFVFKVRGYVQADARFYLDDHSPSSANDTFLLRRVRPIFEGTVFERYDYRVMLDFGSGVTSGTANNGFLQDGYLTARFRPELQVQAGKFKEPVGLERLQSGRNLLFVERGYPTQLVPNRDAGVQLQGDLARGLLSYAVGAFNGVADGGSGDFETADDDKDVAARIFVHPFRDRSINSLKGLGFGIAGTYGNQEGALRTFVSPGQQRFFSYRTGAGTTPATANVIADGRHWRATPQGYYFWGPFGIFGEYVISDQEVRRDDGTQSSGQLRHTAWQASASLVLTGEANGWNGITPRKPFDPVRGGWGAWELAARYGELDVDNDSFPAFANPATSASWAQSWGAGLNWHLNSLVRLYFNYEQTHFKGGDGALFNDGEHVFLGRIQISF